jgi:hypothetical protein
MRGGALIQRLKGTVVYRWRLSGCLALWASEMCGFINVIRHPQLSFTHFWSSNTLRFLFFARKSSQRWTGDYEQTSTVKCGQVFVSKRGPYSARFDQKVPKLANPPHGPSLESRLPLHLRSSLHSAYTPSPCLDAWGFFHACCHSSRCTSIQGEGTELFRWDDSSSAMGASLVDSW